MSNLAIPSLLISLPFLSLWAWAVFIFQQSQTLLSKITLVALFLMLGYFQFAQHYFATFGLILNFFGFSVNIGSSLLFALSLAVVLHLYLTQSPTIFRNLLIYIGIINISICAVACIERTLAPDHIPNSYSPLWSRVAVYKILLGTLLQLFDIGLMVGLYRQLRKYTDTRYGRIVLPLLVALLADAVGFSIILSHYDNIKYLVVLYSQCLCKLSAAILYAACLKFALDQFDRLAIDRPSEPPGDFFAQAIPITRFALWRPKRDRHKHPLTRSEKTVIETVMSKKGTDASGLEDQKRAQQKLRKDWASLLVSHEGKWIAMGPHGLIASAATVEALDEELHTRDDNRTPCIIRFVEPGMEDPEELLISTSPELVSASYHHKSSQALCRAEAAVTSSWSELLKRQSSSWIAFDEEGPVADDVSFDGLQEKLHQMNRDNVIIRYIEAASSPGKLGR